MDKIVIIFRFPVFGFVYISVKRMFSGDADV